MLSNVWSITRHLCRPQNRTLATQVARTISVHDDPRFRPKFDQNPDNPLVHKHVLTAEQFGRSEILKVMKIAKEMHRLRQTGKPLKYAEGKILANLFFEPSTRTASSFACAMMKLGGQVLSLDEVTSSAKKGETMADTLRTISQYTDVIAMRHPEMGSVGAAAQYATRPVINAGDGGGEHPTQALLDIFCIFQELNVETLDGLTVTLVGDLKHGRTVHSLAKLLGQFGNITLNCVAPKILQMPDNVIRELNDSNVNVQQMESYTEVMPKSDIFYMTRVQKERFATEAEYDEVKGLYVLTPEQMTLAKDHMAVLHPLPRVDEIEVGVDHDPRAAYFRQVGCGLSLRMALIAMVLGIPV